MRTSVDIFLEHIPLERYIKFIRKSASIRTTHL